MVDPVTEKDVPQGGRGELWARGPNIMKGYWRNPRATRETLTPDGWLRTGDVAIVDEKGIFFIVDRMKVIESTIHTRHGLNGTETFVHRNSSK